MTSAPPGPRRLPWRWASLAALALCVAQAAADTHVHLDGCEKEVCAVCAIPDPGQVPEFGRVDVRPPEWRGLESMPLLSATLSLRSYEVGRPRAPPVS